MAEALAVVMTDIRGTVSRRRGLVALRRTVAAFRVFIAIRLTQR